jgi:hypothetical protein
MLDISIFTDLCENVIKNLTVSLDEQTYRRAKIAAAERGLSLSALVREYFRSLRDRGEPEYRVEPAGPRSLLEALGDDRLADVDFEIPRFGESVKPADLV